MSSGANTNTSFIPTLFGEICRHHCLIYDQCGGSHTTPCGCIFDKDDDEYKDCLNCEIICRERSVPSHDMGFLDYIQEGRPLNITNIKNDHINVMFPPFIPLDTNRLSNRCDLPFLGIKLQQLITKAKKPSIRRWLYNQSSRDRFNGNDETKFIAVMNGKDNWLEALWRHPNRQALYETLKENRIQFITGPTFSIYSESRKRPASHHVAMQLRHNKIIQEIDQAGLIAIPNIYWRDDLDWHKWIEWINNRPVKLIARDFSLASKSKYIPKGMNRFLELLDEIKKPIHVFFTGVGIHKSDFLVRTVYQETKHSCTVITSNPIAKGLNGGLKLNLNNLNYEKAPDLQSSHLAEYNLAQFNEHMVNLSN